MKAALKFKGCLISCFIILFSNPLELKGQLVFSYGETFDSLYSIAETNLIAGKFKVAAEAYEEAYNLKNKFPVIFFYQEAFLAWYGSKNLQKALFYLGVYIEKGFVTDSFFEKLNNDEKYENLRNHEEWAVLKRKIIQKHGKYGSVVQKLKEIKLRDQTLRQLLECSEEIFGEEAKEHEYLWKLIGREDSLNLVILEKIIEEHGWLGKYKVGEDINGVFWAVIQHSNLDIQERYFPLILESVKKGETEASRVAFLIDRMNLYKGLPQVYGTQIYTPKDGKNKVFPIEDPENVDKRRKEMGFEPLADYLKFFKIEIESISNLQDMKLLEKWK